VHVYDAKYYEGWYTIMDHVYFKVKCIQFGCIFDPTEILSAANVCLCTHAVLDPFSSVPCVRRKCQWQSVSEIEQSQWSSRRPPYSAPALTAPGKGGVMNTRLECS
jgi:hypothetical protein